MPDFICVYQARELREAMFAQVAIEALGIEVLRRGGELDNWRGLNDGMLMTDLLVPADRAEDARRAVGDSLASSNRSRSEIPTWSCSSCGEENDATFEICWKCGEK
jgi:hypothetical protein